MFGARELKRQVRQIIETKLATEILAHKLQSGGRAEVGYDHASDTVTFNTLAPPTAKDAKQDADGEARPNGSAADAPADAKDHESNHDAPPPAVKKQSGKKSPAAKKDAN
jgi:ATP-dependent Clp protease ATP-binding subunit ClpC